MLWYEVSFTRIKNTNTQIWFFCHFSRYITRKKKYYSRKSLWEKKSVHIKTCAQNLGKWKVSYCLYHPAGCLFFYSWSNSCVVGFLMFFFCWQFFLIKWHSYYPDDRESVFVVVQSSRCFLSRNSLSIGNRPQPGGTF